MSLRKYRRTSSGQTHTHVRPVKGYSKPQIFAIQALLPAAEAQFFTRYEKKTKAPDGQNIERYMKLNRIKIFRRLSHSSICL